MVDFKARNTQIIINNNLNIKAIIFDLSASDAKERMCHGLPIFFFFYLCIFKCMNDTLASLLNTASMELKSS